MESPSEDVLAMERKVIDISKVSSDETWRESPIWISCVSLSLTLFSTFCFLPPLECFVHCCPWLQFLRVTGGVPRTRAATGIGINEGVAILLPRLRHSLHLHLHINSRIGSYNFLLGLSRGSITLTVAEFVALRSSAEESLLVVFRFAALWCWQSENGEEVTTLLHISSIIFRQNFLLGVEAPTYWELLSLSPYLVSEGVCYLCLYLIEAIDCVRFLGWEDLAGTNQEQLDVVGSSELVRSSDVTYVIGILWLTPTYSVFGYLVSEELVIKRVATCELSGAFIFLRRELFDEAIVIEVRGK